MGKLENEMLSVTHSSISNLRGVKQSIRLGDARSQQVDRLVRLEPENVLLRILADDEQPFLGTEPGALKVPRAAPPAVLAATLGRAPESAAVGYVDVSVSQRGLRFHRRRIRRRGRLMQLGEEVE